MFKLILHYDILKGSTMPHYIKEWFNWNWIIIKMANNFSIFFFFFRFPQIISIRNICCLKKIKKLRNTIESWSIVYLDIWFKKKKEKIKQFYWEPRIFYYLFNKMISFKWNHRTISEYKISIFNLMFVIYYWLWNRMHEWILKCNQTN